MDEEREIELVGELVEHFRALGVPVGHQRAREFCYAILDGVGLDGLGAAGARAAPHSRTPASDDLMPWSLAQCPKNKACSFAPNHLGSCMELSASGRLRQI